MGLQQFWDERYSQPEYAYGREPNVFFVSKSNLFNQVGC